MHLTGQANPHDLGGIHGADDFTDGLLGALPPIAGVLFAPEWLRARNGVFSECHGHNLPIPITHNCFGTGGADV